MKMVNSKDLLLFTEKHYKKFRPILSTPSLKKCYNIIKFENIKTPKINKQKIINRIYFMKKRLKNQERRKSISSEISKYQRNYLLTKDLIYYKNIGEDSRRNFYDFNHKSIKYELGTNSNKNDLELKKDTGSQCDLINKGNIKRNFEINHTQNLNYNHKVELYFPKIDFCEETFNKEKDHQKVNHRFNTRNDSPGRKSEEKVKYSSFFKNIIIKEKVKKKEVEEFEKRQEIQKHFRMIFGMKNQWPFLVQLITEKNTTNKTKKKLKYMNHYKLF